MQDENDGDVELLIRQEGRGVGQVIERLAFVGLRDTSKRQRATRSQRMGVRMRGGKGRQTAIVGLIRPATPATRSSGREVCRKQFRTGIEGGKVRRKNRGGIRRLIFYLDKSQRLARKPRAHGLCGRTDFFNRRKAYIQIHVAIHNQNTYLNASNRGAALIQRLRKPAFKYFHFENSQSSLLSFRLFQASRSQSAVPISGKFESQNVLHLSMSSDAPKDSVRQARQEQIGGATRITPL